MCDSIARVDESMSILSPLADRYLERSEAKSKDPAANLKIISQDPSRLRIKLRAAGDSIGMTVLVLSGRFAV